MNKIAAVIFVLVFTVALVCGMFGCAKPAPAPTPSVVPAPKPTAAPTPAVKPPTPTTWPKAIRLTTPAVGTSANVYGATVSAIIERNTKVIVTPQPTSGGAEAAQLFAKGEAEMTIANGFVLQSIYFGREGFTKAPDRMRWFSGAYKTVVHFIVRADSNIKTFADLKGKRCMFDRPADTTYADAYRAVLKAYGISEKDVTIMPSLGPKDSAQALRERTADASLVYSAPPVPEYVELDRTIPICLLPIAPDKQAQILKDIPYENIVIIKGGTYRGTPTDTPALSMDAPICIARQLPDDFVYAATKAVVTNFADLQAAHAMFKTWQPAELAAISLVPFHPAVLKYYKEAGFITPEMEQKHNDLLKQMNQPS